MTFIGVIIAIIVFYLFMVIRVYAEYERAVIFRLGRVLQKPKGPGLILVFVPIDRAVRVNLRTVTLDVPPQDVITKDNVSVKINAVCYFRVIDPIKAIIEVENYQYAISQLAQTTLRSVIGQVELDEVLIKRDQINELLQTILDKQTDPWGVKISMVEVKDVDISDELKKAIARQAEAERERRAKVISAEGEFQAAEKLCKAAEMMQKFPVSIQLRYLQTLVEIGKSNNTTTVFPVPMEFMKSMKII